MSFTVCLSANSAAQLATNKTIAIGTDLYSGLLQASDGSYYTKNQGVATEGCADNENNNCSTIYKVSPNGTTTVFHNFQETSTLNNADGLQPTSLIEASDGNFYGTCAGGGSAGYGTIFKIAPDGTFNLLYDFPATPATASSNATATVGSSPMALVEGTDGDLYGVAMAGIPPEPAGDYGPGLFFRIDKGGTAFTQVHIFSQYSLKTNEGGYPSSLMQADDGNFYVTMGIGQTQGSSGYPGAIDRVTPDGVVTVFVNLALDGSQGSAPMGPLAEGSDGSFYGTTATSATPPDGKGYTFTLSKSGVLKTTHQFTGGAAGLLPRGAPLMASDGNLYGDSGQGGDTTNPNCFPPYGCGLVYQLTTSGVFTDLHDFEGGIATSTSVTANPKVDGATPTSPIVQGPGGTLYGSTEGNNNSSTVFALSLTSALPSPIQLSFNPSSVTTGGSTVLTWKVLNAYSKTAQLCGGTVLPTADQADSEGVWNGEVQAGKLTGAVYSGTATIKPIAAGAYTFALTCGGVQSGFATLTVTGNSPLKIQTTSVPKATVSQPYTVAFGATGGVTPYIWTEAGDLPKGLTFEPGTGILSGKPEQFGAYSFAVGVQDSSNPPLNDAVTIAMSVVSGLTLSSALPTQSPDKPYLAQLDTAGGVPPYDYKLISGELPPGLIFNAVNGVISGTATETGKYTFVIQASDSENPKATVQTTFVLPTIGALQLITPNKLPGATINVPYMQALAATGGTPPYSWAFGISDNANYKPPAGLTLSTNGILAGTPKQSQPVGYSQYFVVDLSDSSSPKATVQVVMSLDVKSTLTITNDSLPTGRVGQTTEVLFAGTGGVPPYTWSAASIPSPLEIGLYLNPDHTGLIYDPLISTTANVTIYLQDSEPNPVTSQVSLPLLILPAGSVTTTTLTPSNTAAGTGESVSFTATVAGAGSGSATPTGTVTFYNGTTSIGVATLNATGQATLKTSFASAGAYSITASYSGDTLFLASTSAAISETVVTPSLSAAVTPGSLTILPGASGQLTITLTPKGDYAGTVQFSCGTLPAHISCTFAPPSVTITAGSGPVTDTLTINTNASSSPTFSAAANRNESGALLIAATFWLPGLSLSGSLAALVGIAPGRRKMDRRSARRRLRIVAILGSISCGLLSSCGGTSNNAKAGTYTIPISVSVGGASTQTINATIIIN